MAFGGCAAVAPIYGEAIAAPWSLQITELQRRLSTQDAGSGPVQIGLEALPFA
jgi:hypothetical protein